MKYISWTDEGPYPIAILSDKLNKDQLEREYINCGLNKEATIALGLFKAPGKKKTPKKEIVEYISSELVPTLNNLEVEYVICTDPEYYKALTNQDKAAAMVGYVVPCSFGPYQVVYAPSAASVMYDPVPTREKIKQSIRAMEEHATGAYSDVGSNIIKFEAYPKTPEEIKEWLDKLIDMDVPLTMDIEAFSLKAHTAGIGTISFAWSQHEGIAFAVDYEEIQGATEAPYGIQGYNKEVRALLKDFFVRLAQKQIWHNIAYDVTVLIYQLFMEDIENTEGLLEGMGVMLSNWDDTKLIAYLATNSCAGNALSLKEQAQEFAGNYAESEIEDITKIPLANLLRYNLIDSLSTKYTYDKRHPQMIQDQQEDVYLSLFKPALVDIIQMQLTGLPLDMERTLEVEQILQKDCDSAISRIRSNLLVQIFDKQRRQKWADKKNSTYKVKRVTADDCNTEFNPNSGQQVQMLLYETLELPVLSYTDSKQPSTDKDTLKALKNHTKDQEILNLLDALLDLTAVSKILSSFIPAMKNAVQGKSGWYYLCGYFNLGGTVSGRLSSSNPKQNWGI